MPLEKTGNKKTHVILRKRVVHIDGKNYLEPVISEIRVITVFGFC